MHVTVTVVSDLEISDSAMNQSEYKFYYCALLETIITIIL